MPAKRILALILPELLTELGLEELSAPALGACAPAGVPRASKSVRRAGKSMLAKNTAARSMLEKSATAEKSGAKLLLQRDVPLAIVLDAEEPAARLDAVNRAARRFGISVGQTVVEAKAALAQLIIRSVSMNSVRAALARVAEVAMEFGSLVSVESEALLNGHRRAPDTVWLDITGAAHLKGGEEELAHELEEQVRALGYEVRVAIASGKYLAQAFARWSRPSERVLVVASSQTQEFLAELPVLALPLAREYSSWLVRLGVLSIKDLTALPRQAAVSRLGPEAEWVLDLCLGKDDAPLVMYRPPRVLVEEKSWEEPVTGVEPLMFILSGLVSRVSARLRGRGEAAQRLVLDVSLDESIARLRKARAHIELRFDLASPLWRERDLFKVMNSRLERLSLPAPSIGLGLRVSNITPAVERQLDLSRVSGGAFASVPGHEELPVLLAELNADIGKDNLGVLTINDEHLAEFKSILVPANPNEAAPGRRSRRARRRREQSQQQRPSSAKQPELRKTRAGVVLAPEVLERSLGTVCTRLLPEPLRVSAPLKVGATLSIGTQLCSIQSVNFEYRLDAVRWWTQPVARDYFKVVLKGPSGVFEVMLYVERESGQRFVQAICD